MSEAPAAVLRMIEVLESLPGVRDGYVSPESLDGVELSDLSLPGEFGDLPQVALRRSDGGFTDEIMVRCELRLDPTREAWLTIEFLAWWVRDWARSGHSIQMRPMALPPRTDHIQLGGTLKFFVEYFHIDDSGDFSKSLAVVTDMAESIADNYSEYQDCFEHPAAPNEDNDAIGFTFEELVERAADDPSAAYEVARAYATGEGAEEDPEQAFFWYSHAAQQQHPLAMFFAGRCHEHGEGTEVDCDQALAYYRQAAALGMPLAMAAIGEMYMEGHGVAADPAEGFSWYQRAADTGDAVCEAELGDCYEFGKGIPPDLNAALEWYQRSWDKGFTPVEEALQRVKAALGLS